MLSKAILETLIMPTEAVLQTLAAILETLVMPTKAALQTLPIDPYDAN
jgi:hypothetical protein